MKVLFNAALRTVCLCVLLSICVGGVADAQSKKKYHVGGKEIDVAVLDKQINELLEATGVPGLSLAIIDNNQVVYSNAYGIRSFESRMPVDKETVFNGGSLSKTYLVFTANKLADQGKLDLDKPMYEYLPFPRLAHDDRYKRITSRMVLAHMSGIENWQSDNDGEKLEIVSEPGTDFVYSGEGYHYLADVIEKLLGQSYQEYTEKLVIKPLRLNHTLLSVAKEGNVPENYADNHNAFKEKRPLKLSIKPAPAYGNYFTAEEYAKLVMATYNEHYFRRQSINSLWKVPATQAPEISTPEKGTYMYSLSGYYIIHSKKDSVVHFVGSGDGNFSVLAYSPSRKCGVVFMTNSGAGYFIVSKMGALTTDFDIDWTFRFDKEWEYPALSARLMGKYDPRDSKKLLTEVRAVYEKERPPLDDFKPLGGFLDETNKPVCNEYLLELIQLYPNDSWTYEVLAKRYLNKSEYKEALGLLKQAQGNGVQSAEVQSMIKTCNDNLESKP